MDFVAAVAGCVVVTARRRDARSKRCLVLWPAHAAGSPGADAGVVRSPVAGSGDEADELVDGDDEDAEHEMAHDFRRAAHTDGAAAGLVLEPAEDALDRRPGLVADGLGAWQVDRAAGQSRGLLVGFLRGAAGDGFDQRNVAEAAAHPTQQAAWGPRRLCSRINAASYALSIRS